MLPVLVEGRPKPDEGAVALGEAGPVDGQVVDEPQVVVPSGA